MFKSFSTAFVMAATAAICFSVWVQLSSPLVVDLSEISLNNKGERIYQGQLFSGEMVSFYPSGQLAASDQFVDGRRQGYSRKWFQDGVLAFESNYVSERREGYVRSWWSNGNPRSEAFYENGKKEGVSWTWYASGEKFVKANFSAGEPVGIQQGWRQNGDLFSNFEYRNGRVYGLKKANTCIGIEDEVVSLDYYKEQES